MIHQHKGQQQQRRQHHPNKEAAPKQEKPKEKEAAKEEATQETAPPQSNMAAGSGSGGKENANWKGGKGGKGGKKRSKEEEEQGETESVGKGWQNARAKPYNMFEGGVGSSVFRDSMRDLQFRVAPEVPLKHFLETMGKASCDLVGLSMGTAEPWISTVHVCCCLFKFLLGFICL